MSIWDDLKDLASEAISDPQTTGNARDWLNRRLFGSQGQQAPIVVQPTMPQQAMQVVSNNALYIVGGAILLVVLLLFRGK